MTLAQNPLGISPPPPEILFPSGGVFMFFKKLLKGLAFFSLSLTLSLFIVLSFGVVGGGVWLLSQPDRKLPEEIFLTGIQDRTTRLYVIDETGAEKELSADRVSGSENALFCPISEIPANLQNAFIAIEDKRFYEHGGVDYLRTAAALSSYLKTGHGSFGGSTITQQLIKNLTGDSEKSFRRKALEILRAAEAEQKFSKSEILEQYLNVVNLSGSCYGVRTAANYYFSKEVAELSLPECAALAAITNNPSRYDPIKHPEANRERRDLILLEMCRQGMISETERANAAESETVLCVNPEVGAGRINSWYADMVIRDVISDLVKEKGMSEAAASRLLYCGGLKIYTVMDEKIQQTLSEYYLDRANFPTHEGGKKAQSAMMIVDPENGRILAVAGAVGEKNSNRIQNFATDTGRPSGSAIKPLAVYGPALEKDLITYATVLDDVPQSYRSNGAPWPRNAPNFYRGLINVNEALTNSVNTASVSILKMLGNENAFRFLTDKIGFTSLDSQRDKGAAALALGQQTNGVTLRELMGGYTAVAGGGVYQGTHSYSRVLDAGGKELLRRGGEERRVFSEETAGILTMMLRHVVEEGTGRAVTLKTKTDVAGKTGTSSHNCDKWFIGYTPELLAGVWYGFEYPASLSDVSGNPALTVFDEVLGRVIAARGVERHQFSTPEDLVAVRYCKDSGKLLSDACYHDPRGDRSEVGYFKVGTEPTGHCDCHVLVDYCSGGGVATPECPAECRHQTALLRVSRHFKRQIAVRDAPFTYEGEAGNMGQNFRYNEPYYSVNYETKQFFGIAMGEIPYNHACPVHSADAFWQRRLLVAEKTG